MKGLRASGHNKGALNHTGDFVLLYSPLMRHLENLAVCGPEIRLPWPCVLDTEDAIAVAETNKADDLARELARLQLHHPANKGPVVEEPYYGYYGPGFFPRFAPYIVDDWNELLCFAPPYPEFAAISKAGRTTDRCRLEQKLLSLNLQFCFRNIDAFLWEFFARDEQHVELVRMHLRQQSIRFEELDFVRDYH